MTIKQSYPLRWPQDQERTVSRKKARSRASWLKAMRALETEMSLRKATACQVATNTIKGKLNPPYSCPGVSVVYKSKKKTWLLACDNYLRISDNLMAIVNTLKYTRMARRSPVIYSQIN